MSALGLVAIGRNEGEQMRRCLESVMGRGLVIVYVDSGSVDGSVELARSLGADVVELDLSRPFTAARARNEGFERLCQIAPQVRFVQFVDGDCAVANGWLEKARGVLEKKPDVGVVCGRRRERFPDQTVYNRLADLEWDSPVGESKACGGDAMMRFERSAKSAVITPRYRGRGRRGLPAYPASGLEGVANRRRHDFPRHGDDSIQPVVEKINKNGPRIRRGVSHVRPHGQTTFRAANPEYDSLGDSLSSGSPGPGLAKPGSEPLAAGRIPVPVPTNLSLLRRPARLAAEGRPALRTLDCARQVSRRSSDSLLAGTTFRSTKPGHRVSRLGCKR